MRPGLTLWHLQQPHGGPNGEEKGAPDPPPLRPLPAAKQPGASHLRGDQYSSPSNPSRIHVKEDVPGRPMQAAEALWGSR